MIQACSHLVIATEDVGAMTVFFKGLFEVSPHFSNEMFSEFVLPSRFRIAFFKPVGAAAKYFSSEPSRKGLSLGVTVDDVEALYRKASTEFKDQVELSGPPKDHPWGEKSFLLIDPDGNRWEIVQSPSDDGLLVNIDSQGQDQ